MLPRINPISLQLTVALGLLCSSALAQRVQFPATTAPPDAFAPPSTFAAPPTFGTPPISVGPPPATLPYNAPPTTTAPVSPWQQYPNAPAAPSYQQQPGALLPNGVNNPFGWQQGSWSFQGEDGYIVQAQRFLQEMGVEHTWLHGDGSADNFEIHRSEIYSTFAIPMPYSIETPILVTPGFAANWFEGPVGDPAGMPRGPDLPPRTYDAYLDVAWYPQFSEVIGAELGARTGVWTDFDHTNSDSVRILGRGLVKVAITPQLDVLVGAVYLDRVRVKFLPAGGFYYRPTPEWDMYLVFPNPKVRKHFTTIGNSEWYWYVTGEYGGGSWTVSRAGTPDRIDINDIRVSAGLEWETLTKIRGHIEAGYVFDREVLFDETGMPREFKPDDTFMVRGGVDF